MEMLLNLAWAACSLGLICFWVRYSASNALPRRKQVLALGVIVLLLLPVISLSDDLMAMQNPAETDICVRKAAHPEAVSHFLAKASFAALPEAMVTSIPAGGSSWYSLQPFWLAPLPVLQDLSLDSRPPPQN